MGKGRTGRLSWWKRRKKTKRKSQAKPCGREGYFVTEFTTCATFMGVMEIRARPWEWAKALAYFPLFTQSRLLPRCPKYIQTQHTHTNAQPDSLEPSTSSWPSSAGSGEPRGPQSPPDVSPRDSQFFRLNVSHLLHVNASLIIIVSTIIVAPSARWVNRCNETSLIIAGRGSL